MKITRRKTKTGCTITVKAENDADKRRLTEALRRALEVSGHSPCCNCLRTWNVDPCHTGSHGMGQKSCDLKTIPLCRSCHIEFDAAPRGFAERNKLDIPALIERFNRAYREITGKAA